MYFIWFRSLRALSNAVLVSKSCLSVSSSLRERRGEGRETKEEREEKERREWKLKNTRVCISSLLPLLTYIKLKERIHVQEYVYMYMYIIQEEILEEAKFGNLAICHKFSKLKVTKTKNLEIRKNTRTRQKL